MREEQFSISLVFSLLCWLVLCTCYYVVVVWLFLIEYDAAFFSFSCFGVRDFEAFMLVWSRVLYLVEYAIILVLFPTMDSCLHLWLFSLVEWMKFNLMGKKIKIWNNKFEGKYHIHIHIIHHTLHQYAITLYERTRKRLEDPLNPTTYRISLTKLF